MDRNVLKTLTHMRAHTHKTCTKCSNQREEGGKSLSTMLQFKSKRKKKIREIFPPTCQEMSSNILKARITK